MIDSAFENRVKNLSDGELDCQMSSAYQRAYYESFGRDFEAHADAIQEYEILAREWKRRRTTSEHRNARLETPSVDEVRSGRFIQRVEGV